ncbi:DUF1700 domain-containing protein [Brevibacillus massiliensis]|uniref:DUF1700 domain-containing protein n=1 Tax=Brevibacillus massiliensis TaxID=1118054 RepID=UPI00031E5F01|nr:DUF1700 domain-containing protein [Brevibacillus massiliensis]
MKRAEYIGTLEALLKVLPEAERRDILYDYEEHFAIAMEAGKSEEEVCKALGQPKAIAKELIANYYIGKAKEHVSMGNVTRAVLATVGMGFFQSAGRSRATGGCCWNSGRALRGGTGADHLTVCARR